MKYLVTNIKYDTDGFDVALPETLEIEIPEDIENIKQFISDEISNQTGYCHFGYNTTPKIED